MTNYLFHNLKTLTCTTLLICLSFYLNAKVYYSTNSNNAAVTSSWTDCRCGIGLSPTNFNQSDTFIIQASHTMFTGSSWLLSGTNVGLIIENGGILNATDSVNVSNTAIFNIKNGGTYIHANKSNAPTAIFNGSEIFEPTSNVEIKEWKNADVPITVSVFGNLKITYNNTAVWNQKNNISTIEGSFLLHNGSSSSFQFANNNDYTLTINKNFIIKTGTFSFSGPYTKAYKLNIKGAYLQTGGTVRNPVGGILPSIWTINFTGDSSSFYKRGGNLINTQINFSVQVDAKLYLATLIRLASRRTFTVDGSLYCDTFKMIGSGIFRLNNNASLYIGSDSGIAPVGSYYGNINTTFRTYATNATYIYYGRTQQYSGMGIPGDVLNLKVELANANHKLILNKSINVFNRLYLTSGRVLTNSNLLSLGSSALSPGRLEVANGFVIGTFARYFAPRINLGTSGLFPIGIDNIYRPLQLEFTTAPINGGLISAKFIDIDPGDIGLGITDGGFNLSNSSESGYWKLEILNGNFNLGVFTTTLFPNNFTDIIDPSILHLLTRNTGSAWLLDGDHSASYGTITNPVVIRTNMTKIGEMGISINLSDLPLPVSWNSFNVNRIADYASLNWATNIEINNEYFVVERSLDAVHFNQIGQIKAIGNSAELSSYYFNDDEITKLGVKTIYYRIKQVDKDLKYTYSYIKSIDIENQTSINTIETNITVYPNPSTDFIQVNTESEIRSIIVYDFNGKIQLLQEASGMNASIQIADLAPASYILTVEFANQQRTQKTIIKN